MNPQHVQLAARVLIAQIFFIAGIRKALAFGGAAAYFARLGLPASELVTVLVVLIEIGGSIALVLGWRLRDVALGLRVFTLASGFIGHAFWAVEPAQFAGQLNNFMKNVAIAGAFLLLASQGHKSAQKN